MIVLVALLGSGLATHPSAQAPAGAELRGQLASRYDIVALQRGVGLVPRDATAQIRLIQIVEGTVSIDGMVVTAAETRERLGRDADAIIRLTFLDAAGRDAFTGAAAAAAASSTDSPREPRTDGRRRLADVVRFGGSVTVAADERVEGDVVAIEIGRAHV